MAAQNRFNPTDQELVELYLLNIVRGKPHPTDHDIVVLINTANVYGDCGTWEKFSELLETDTLYFFTRLTPLSGNDSRICRVATEGTWKGQHGPKVIKDVNGEIIGSNGNFSFIPKEGFPEPSSKWVMHEFRLHSEGRYADIDNLNALCRIRKTKSINGSTAAIDIDEEALNQKMMEFENVIRGRGEGEEGH